MKKDSDKEKDISHFLPIKAMSINECFQGRRYKTKKYDKFIADMLRIMPKEKPMDGLLEVELIFGVRSLFRGDVDNLIKPVLDCLTKRGWIADDRYVMSVKATKVKAKQESISVFVKNLDKS